jgi:hypothetical protein
LPAAVKPGATWSARWAAIILTVQTALAIVTVPVLMTLLG